MTRKGKLIVFEGPDGVGKSTLAEMLVSVMKANSIQGELLAFPGNAKGEIGYLVYRLHHNPIELEVNEITEASLQTLHVAAHIDAIERKIIPRLREGSHVILDRYWWSTWVYGVVGGISKVSLSKLKNLETSFWGQFLPDIVFLVDRDESFREEMGQRKWNKLRSEYRDLCNLEKQNYPVVILQNTASLDVTLEEMVEILKAHNLVF